MTDSAEAPEVPKKRLGTGAVVGLVMAIGLASGIGATWLRGTDGPSGPSYPSSWDPRIASLVTYVEAHRGHTFKHPVYVEFLADAEFVKEVTSDASDLSEQDKKDQANEQALLRAAGLISGTTDLFKAGNALSGSGVIGLYSNGDKKIRVRGDHLTPSVKATLVHELTHVMQDQYFDLSATYKRVDDDKTADGYAFHAIVEGDAMRIEEGYRKSQSAADRAAIAKAETKDAERSDKGSASVPEFMQALFSAAYPLGEYAVRTAFAKGGNKGVDELFQNPPLHDSVVLDPYLIDRPLALPKVPALPLKPGEKEIERGVWGSFPLYLMIAKDTPYARAVNIAEGDLNDRYLQYSVGSKTCVRADFAARGPEWASALHEALTRWAQKAHTGATVKQSGIVVTINSCDPGPKYVPSPDHSNDALHVLVERNAGYYFLRSDGIPTGFAICYANGVIDRFSVKDLDRLDGGDNTTADQAVEKSIGLACRTGKA